MAESPPADSSPSSLAQSNSALISALPKHEGWSTFPLRLYQNSWVPEHLLPSVFLIQAEFKPRPTDIILASVPKSGTTWLKALAFAISNRHRYSFTEHPLLARNPHECVPYLEIPYHGEGANLLTKLEKLPSPRLLGTHMPISMLPASVMDSDCRIVFLCRDPKDVLVSFWQFVMKNSKKAIDINRFFELFCEGVLPRGPFWELVVGYWKESLKRPEKILFLRYEELIDDTARIITRLADFLGCPFEEEEERNGVVEEVVRLCSLEMLSGLEITKTGKTVIEGKVIEHSAFFRNGRVGDWKNYLTEEMAKRLDSIVEQKLQGSGLVF